VWALVAVAWLIPWGGDDCSGAPCQDGFLVGIWAAVAVFALWLLA
jgi:hypothetical protein